MNLDQRTIKRSTERLVVSGRTFEYYRYACPYFYNFPPNKQSAAAVADDAAIHNEGGKRRADNLAVARRSLRRLIEANATAWPERTKFITYTFAENVREYDEAMRHWTAYARRLKDRFGPQKYVGVVEFQKRGAVHFHVLHFTIPYVRGLKHVLAKDWGHGFIKIKALEKIKSVSAYVSKYLRKGTVDSRLCRKKAYFTSRGLVQPYELRDPDAIAAFAESGILLEETNVVFPSAKFGSIIYSRGYIQGHDIHR